jgi:rhodanese-related sulfurtransferase
MIVQAKQKKGVGQMRRLTAVILIILLGTITTACTIQKGDNEMNNTTPRQNNQETQITSAPATSALITADEAKRRLDSGESIILLDVRTEEEYIQKHIPNSILIPLNDLENDVEAQLPDKDATLFVYCRSGNRSTSASKILVKLGYKNVYDLGGIIDWPYETESGEQF